MEKLNILNKKETEEILELVRKQWGAEIGLDGLGVLKNTKNKVYLARREIFSFDMENLRINSVGMYFVEVIKNECIRLSIDGSQLVGPKAKKNVVELGDNEARRWLHGEDIEKNPET